MSSPEVVAKSGASPSNTKAEGATAGKESPLEAKPTSDLHPRARSHPSRTTRNCQSGRALGRTRPPCCVRNAGEITQEVTSNSVKPAPPCLNAFRASPPPRAPSPASGLPDPNANPALPGRSEIISGSVQGITQNKLAGCSSLTRNRLNKKDIEHPKNKSQVVSRNVQM